MKNFTISSAIVCLVSLFPNGAKSEEERTVRVQFRPGADSSEITDRISGRGSVIYQLNAREGQFLSVSLRPDNQSANFNIYIPGEGPGDEALFVSDLGGREYVGQLHKTGDHKVAVFLNRAAARRGEKANFDILFKITNEPPAKKSPESPAAGFRKEVSYQDIGFTVTSSNQAEGNKFTITPSGLTTSNEQFTLDADGKVVEVMIDDIDGDNFPEVALITEEPEEKRRTARVFTSFGGKSFGMVSFPPVTDIELLTGYAGGDEFNFVENTFIRRFPLHEKGAKTVKTRQLQFKLKPGESMKQLVLDRHTDY